MYAAVDCFVLCQGMICATLQLQLAAAALSPCMLPLRTQVTFTCVPPFDTVDCGWYKAQHIKQACSHKMLALVLDRTVVKAPCRSMHF